MTRPNILLLVLDAVRADHLSCYGHHRQTTPNIDELAASGRRYEHAFANSNWTGGSHPALFSGLLPSQSGVYGDNMVLPDDVDVLAERLQRGGYRTFATSAGAHIRGDRGYDRGFDEFHETYRVNTSATFLRTLFRDPSARRQLWFSGLRGHDNYTLYKFDRLQRWVDSGSEPFFAFVNCKTAHNPYNPPRPYKSAFCDGLDRPRYEFVERLRARAGGEPQDIAGVDEARLDELSWQYPILAGAIEPTDRELEILTAWYDGAIRYMDDRLGEFVDFLRGRGLLSETHIVVTADHGELFGEHGLEKHHYSLYDPVLHVPLVIKPAATGRTDTGTVQEPVSLVDLYPTILEWAGLDSPDRPNAESLAATGRPQADRYLYAEVGSKSAGPIQRHYPSFDGTAHDGPLQSVRDDQYKLIRDRDGGTELYRWREDPAERDDVADANPAVVERLTAALDADLQPMSSRALDEDIDDPALESHLEDLGYL